MEYEEPAPPPVIVKQNFIVIEEVTYRAEVVKEGFSISHFRTAIARIIGKDHFQLNLLTELTSVMT